MAVGGRVVDVRAAGFFLGDAFARVFVSLDGDASLPELGELVVAEGHFTSEDGPSLHAARLLERAPGLEPTSDSEVGRIAWGGRGRALRARSRARDLVRDYFREEGFIEVETPSLVPCPGLDPNVDSLGGVQRGARTDYLITSPELHMKRLLSGGLPRIYQLSRCYRAEELGRRHEPEFTMLEWYRAFADYEEALRDTEEVVSRVVRDLSGSSSLRVTFSDKSSRVFDVTPPFERITVRDAFTKYAGVSDACELALDDEARYFELLVDRVEPGLAESSRPIFLLDYPASQAALARRSASDPSVAERFELYLAGVELCNGFGELTDAAEQRRRFELERERRASVGAPVYPLDERFLGALAQGMPRATGNALGFDRLVSLALGTDEIASAMAFSDAER